MCFQMAEVHFPTAGCFLPNMNEIREVTGEAMAKKILLVEDYEDTRQLMAVMLSFCGCQVVEAKDGYEAVEKAISERPDLILMDIGMPILDGLSATQAIRQHAELADIPIVALTAYGDFYEDKAIAAGCNEVIQKPFDFEQLPALVDRYTLQGERAPAAL